MAGTRPRRRDQSATRQPATTPITGDQRRSRAVPFSVATMMTIRATTAQSGAASAGVPAGTSFSSPKADGINVAGTTMMPMVCKCSTGWSPERSGE